MKNFLQSVVNFLHAKKAIILALSFAVFGVLVSQHIVSLTVALLGQAIFHVLGVAADITTTQVGVSPSVSAGK